MKERTYFFGCLQVLASQCAMKYCPSCLMTSVTEPLAIEARQRRHKKESRKNAHLFPAICTYIALRYPRRFVTEHHRAPPILHLRKNSNSRVIQILSACANSRYQALFPPPPKSLGTRLGLNNMIALEIMVRFLNKTDTQGKGYITWCKKNIKEKMYVLCFTLFPGV